MLYMTSREETWRLLGAAMTSRASKNNHLWERSGDDLALRGRRERI